MAVVDFSSPKRLCRWAYEEICNFERAEEAFFDKNAYDIVPILDGPPVMTPILIYRLRTKKRASDEIERSAYRVVGDLRNALDQAVSSAVEATGASRGKYTNFPFAVTEVDFNRRLASLKGAFRDIPADLHPLLHSFEPFVLKENGSHGNELLCFLNEIANPNKHQLTLEVGINLGTFTIWTETQMRIELLLRRISDTEFDLFRGVPEGPDPQVHFGATPAFFIKHGSAHAKKGAANVLSELHKLTESIVLKIEKAAMEFA
jgi:hypothetical protein